MKRSAKQIFPIIIAAVILLLFGAVLSIYTTPTKNVSLDLSLMPPADGDLKIFDTKGWVIYTREEDAVTELIPDGFGGYTGLEPGQTIYFSRLMTEDLDSPTLQVNIADRNFAIFLDDALIYTDCPQLDNRIGRLHLPAREQEVREWLTISLPANYHGKVLTIAQSTGIADGGAGSGAFCAYPAQIRLCCGYSYESDLIAESFSAAILATLLFLVGAALLAAYVRFHSYKCLCMAFVAFLWMAALLCSLSFFQAYFQISDFDVVACCRLTSAYVLVIYLSLQSGRQSWVISAWSTLCSLAMAAFLFTHLATPQNNSDFISFLKGPLQEWLLSLSLVVAVFLCIGRPSRENLFCRLFVPLTIAVSVIYWELHLILRGSQAWRQICLDLQCGQITYLYYRTVPLIISTALAAATVHVFYKEIHQRTEKQLLEQRREMTLASYENMRRQHEEIMIIRHDMIRHFRALRAMTDQAQISAYLDDILGQNSKIRPVVQSGNEMLDIILNSRLSDAMDNGILVDIVKAEVPGNLPLTDADLCSLVMNITDNALTAAGKSTDARPYIRLDLHVKGNFMVLVCENSAAGVPRASQEKSKTVQKHGLGLKIIRSIVQKYEGLVDTEYNEAHYRIRVAIPLL